jgi:diguanylate cyclase (GGDEF)-like protein
MALESTTSGDVPASPDALSNEAMALMPHHPAAALSLAERVLASAATAVDPHARSRCLFVRGTVHMQRGAYDAAAEDLACALECADDADQPELALQARRALIECCFFRRRLDDALRHGVECLRLARALNDPVAEARACNDLGLVHGDLGDYDRALEHLQAGLRVVAEYRLDGIAKLHNNIGNVHAALGDHREALQAFEAAAQAFREEESGRGMAIALGNVGRACAALGRDEEALEAYQRSVVAFEQRGDVAYVPAARARLATALAGLGRTNEAMSAFDQAIMELETPAAAVFQDEVLLPAAEFWLEQGQSARALEALVRLDDVLSRDGSGGGDRHHRLYELLAEACARTGDFEAALRYHKRFHAAWRTAIETANAVKVRALMLQFDVEQAEREHAALRAHADELSRANAELQSMRGQLEHQNRDLERISVEDALTGLHNRRYLDMQLPKQIARARRHQRPLCVAVCDIDHFKAVNDRYSHAIGDEVLRRIGRIMTSVVREADLAIRFGGEEFVLLLPDTDLAGADLLVQRIRSAVATHPWSELAPELRVTLSAGLAELTAEIDADGFLAMADARLYAAKRAGRDRVVA